MADSKFKRADWIAATNIYEVNLRQYTAEGTFNAFAKELPRLKDMGVEVLWLMPIHPIGKINRKGKLGSYYSIQDFKAVSLEFGTADDLKNLIAQTHALGMKLIMDWVANHASWDNEWAITHPEYFCRDHAGNFEPPYDWTDVIQIDHSNPAEQEAMIDAMKYWVTGFDIDGFRADLAHLTPLDFWKKARTAIEPLKPNLFWLAESEEINYHQVFDATFTWEWMHVTEAFYKRSSDIDGLYKVLHKYKTAFPADAYRMYFTSNHDENSWNGTAYEKYGDLSRILSVFSFTWNGIPMIYSGQEMPNLKRLKFFEKDTIAWNGEYKLHDFYKTLASLRSGNTALRAADPRNSTDFVPTSAGKEVLAYMHKNEKDAVFVMLNASCEKASFTINEPGINGTFYNVFSNVDCLLSPESYFEIDPWEFLVFEKK